MNKAVFLDRDGVLNKNIYYESTKEWESPRTLEEFEFLPETFEVLKNLFNMGYKLFIVTNQPSFAKGKTSLDELLGINEFALKTLQDNGIKIEKLYCSFNHPKSVIKELAADCKYRKPSPTALIEAAQEFDLELAYSWMIGDRMTDIECGLSANTRTIYVKPDYKAKLEKCDIAHYSCLNILEAAAIISKYSGE